MDQQTGRLKTLMTISAVVLTAIIGLGLLWFLFLAPKAGAEIGRMGWYLFSFAAGLTMIVLPCTLPLAFVIVPLSMGKGLAKGLGMALSFGAGVAIMLSMYGVVVALLGRAGIDFLGAGGEDVKNWVYFFAGTFAYIFALGELGLVKFRMPSYTGAAPDFIQKRKDFAKAFLLGIFLGNIGIGCPHPATPLILIEIASAGDLFYGWSLFFIHAIGRVLPLVLLSVLAVLGVNGLNWLLAHKERIERANGWAMVFVAGFILTLGLFSHDWWTNSGQHNLLEKVTQEQWFTGRINAQLATEVAHTHGVAPASSRGIFGQPLEWGNWFIVFLWILPFWWNYRREKKRVLGTPALQIEHLEHKLLRAEEERRGIEAAIHIPDGEQGARVKELESQMDALIKERTAVETGIKFGPESGLRDPSSQKYEEELLRMRRSLYATLAVFLVVTFAIFLPFWFMNFEGVKSHGGDHAPATTAVTVSGAIKAIDAGANQGAGAMPMDESMPHGH